MLPLEKLTQWIYDSNYIVALTGAGVSTESGIPDFRSASTGLYNQSESNDFPPEVMLSHSFFIKHPDRFFKFYKEKMIYKNALPNKAHKAMAELEKIGKMKAVVTQNIDGLHQSGGSTEVLELHGSIHRNYCMNCRKFYDLNYICEFDDVVPRCSECGGIVKPDVVLYEEMLDQDIMGKSVAHIRRADMMIVGGTSLLVHPAAGLVNYFKGNRLVLINKSSTPYDNDAALIIRDNIGETLDKAINIK